MDKNTLLANRVTDITEDVEIPGVGTIKIRGLSRFEFLLAEKLHGGDTLKQERYILSNAIVDPSGLTEDDIAAWQKASGPMEINSVAAAVNRMSGIGKAAAKSGVPEVRDES